MQNSKQLDWTSGSTVRKSQFNDPVWQILANMFGEAEVWVQKDNPCSWSYCSANNLVPTRMPPDPHQYTTRFFQRAVWALFCVCLLLGIWRSNVSRPGNFKILNVHFLFHAARFEAWSFMSPKLFPNWILLIQKPFPMVVQMLSWWYGCYQKLLPHHQDSKTLDNTSVCFSTLQSTSACWIAC